MEAEQKSFCAFFIPNQSAGHLGYQCVLLVDDVEVQAYA